jgi:hypothetical protein
MQTKTKIFLLSFLILCIFSISSIRTLALTVSTGVTVLPTEIFHIIVQWAIPEKRVGTPGTNDDTTFFLTLRNPTNHSISWTQPDLLATDVEGRYLGDIVVDSLAAGNYDIGFKGSAHLTKVLRGVALTSGNFTANFTNDTISPLKGPLRLVAGDISGNGLTPATLGDDVVNSVDLSMLVSELDYDDPTVHAYRSNLNQDTAVNSVDLSLLLANLDKEGER